jgi:hypothetical protein
MEVGSFWFQVSRWRLSGVKFARFFSSVLVLFLVLYWSCICAVMLVCVVLV